MGLGQAFAEANIGKIARQGDRAQAQRDHLIAQNDEIIRLLTLLVERGPDAEANRYEIRSWAGYRGEARG